MKQVFSGITGLLVTGLLAAGSVHAAGNGVYVGAGLGYTNIDASSGSINFDDNDTGWKIFGGYDFNENIAVEAAYVDLGEFDDSVLGVPVDLELDGFSVAAVGSFPVGTHTSLHGKLGLWAWDSDATAMGVSADDDGTDFMFGLGGDYAFTEAFSLRAEWERYTADSDDADFFGVSGVFDF